MRGSTRSEALIQASHGLVSILVDPAPFQPLEERYFTAGGTDEAAQIVNWLNEILFLEQQHQVRCEKFQIRELNGFHVRARVETRGCPGYQTGIKAVTFHNLKICKTPVGMEAEVVVDV